MDKKSVLGIGISGGLLLVFGLMKRYITLEPEKYSLKWLQGLSDEDLEKERENVRLEFCSSGSDFEKGARLQHLLGMFDYVLRERKTTDHKENNSPRHREHGWYLPEDD